MSTDVHVLVSFSEFANVTCLVNILLSPLEIWESRFVRTANIVEGYDVGIGLVCKASELLLNIEQMMLGIIEHKVLHNI